MARYLAQRLASGVIVLLFTGLVTFVLLDQTPGDAAQTLAGESATAEQMAALRAELGLDQPVLVRYGRFVYRAVAQGDLGRSLISSRPVTTLVASRFGRTLALAAVTMALALILGGAAGALAAVRAGGALDLALMSAAALGLAVPTFWAALMLMLVFAVRLGWLPVVGAGSPAHLILPAVSLSLPTTAIVARLVRATLLDVRGADFVRTARGKGVAPVDVWRRHVLPNSLIPVLTIVGLHVGHLLGGAFVIESIFGWPGLGRLLVQAVYDRDYPVILGAVLLMCIIYQILNLAVDIAHVALDPRLTRRPV